MLVLPLNDRHDRKGFDCGDADLNGWLRQTARQHKEKGVSSTFVAVVLVPVAGNAAEHTSAVVFATRNRLNVTIVPRQTL